MNLINIIAVGYPKLEAIRDLECHYMKMLKRFTIVNIINLKEESRDRKNQLISEARSIRSHIQSFKHKVLMDADGINYKSEDFALWLGKRVNYAESIVFIIGSSHGFESGLKNEIKEHLSLSRMTFQHDMSRILLLEQLYRAYSICCNSSYHK